ncbi:hypothetical protein [Caloramator sp. Dgby_cultured_2]|uniref:hypothetical protein n=1 Tax=Caloramator sp. Dgby_cultured_2 TaxID=3029174 RepID=UPI00237EDC83|nr:hypothetical protein [Caloramator sp. Dgby_cultured_2]WDU83065.1 hypothetical protein PWK10_17005 [Caloramator sp. Dgby_cultured_2]
MKVAFVVYYSKLNRNSFNALSAALGVDEVTKDIPIYFVKKEEDLIKGLCEIKQNYDMTVVGTSFLQPKFGR